MNIYILYICIWSECHARVRHCFFFSFLSFSFSPQNVLVKTEENNDDDDDYNGRKMKTNQKNKPMKCTMKNTERDLATDSE